MAEPYKPGLMSRIRQSPPVLFLEILSFLGILFAVGTLIRDAGAQYEQRISAAWLVLASKSLGESGKGKALEFLNRDKSYLPRAVCGALPLPPPLCDDRQSFARVDLASAPDENAVIISSSELTGADFSFARLSGVEFRLSNLSHTNFSGADLRHAAFFRSRIEGARFVNANLSGSHFVFDNSLESGPAVQLRHANLSGAVFAIDLDSYLNVLCRQEDRFNNSRLVELIGDLLGPPCEGTPSSVVPGTIRYIQMEKLWDGAGMSPDLFAESWVWSGQEPAGLPDKYRTYFLCDPSKFPQSAGKARFFGFPGLDHCKKRSRA